MSGMWSAIVVALLAVLAAVLMRWKLRSVKKYDERQELLRGRAYRAGFTAMLLTGVGYLLLTVFLDRPLMEDAVCAMFLMFVGLTVFAVRCVWTDAFFTASRQRPMYLALLAVVVVLNGISAIRSLREGGLVANGVLTSGALSWMIAACFLVIGCTILLRGAKGDAE